MFAITLIPVKGYSNPKATTIENHSEKMYIESSKLYFSDEGIFLKTRSDEWRPVGHIYHDSKGYYLAKNSSSNAQIITAKNSKEKEESTWTCPSCYYENTSTNGVCERCLWPLYEWD